MLIILWPPLIGISLSLHFANVETGDSSSAGTTVPLLTYTSLARIFASVPLTPAGPLSPWVPFTPAGPAGPLSPCGPTGPFSPCGPFVPPVPVGPILPFFPTLPICLIYFLILSIDS